jgi:ammonia channel protein AmtB
MNFISIEANDTINATLSQSILIPKELKSFMTQVDLNQLGTNFINLSILSSICSNIALSAIAERQKLGVQICFTILLSIVVLPVVTQWTFGQGFL